MDAPRGVSAAAALIAEPARAAMLWSLMGGESRPAGELAMIANVSPQTASNHLRALTEGGLLRVASSGRHRFYSLSSPSVAVALESLSVAAPRRAPIVGAVQRRMPELAFARVCYDHLAGELAVALLASLRAARHLVDAPGGFVLTREGEALLHGAGVEVDLARHRRRRFAYGCLDWSHRVPHLGGALGAALLEWLVGSRSVTRVRDSRAIRVTDRGLALLRDTFGVTVARSGRIVATRRSPGAGALVGGERPGAA